MKIVMMVMNVIQILENVWILMNVWHQMDWQSVVPIQIAQILLVHMIANARLGLRIMSLILDAVILMNVCKILLLVVLCVPNVSTPLVRFKMF